jgi:hypothetical protein
MSWGAGVVRWNSGGAVGEQNGNAVDDGIAAIAGGTADAVGVNGERLAASGADEPAEIVGLQRHGDRLLVVSCQLSVGRQIRRFWLRESE